MENKKARILIVDDEPEIVSILKDFLSLKGFSVNGASNGEEALSFLETEKPDCVLLDIMMPGMKGTEVAKIIKNKYPSIKVIILTGFLNYADSLIKDNILSGVFKKPVRLQELANKLTEIINATSAPSAKPEEKSKIQARVLIIKAKLLFIEPSYKIYGYLTEYFKHLFEQGKEYELSVSSNEEEIAERLKSFAPDLLVVNASAFKLPKLPENGLPPKEIIIYNAQDVSRLQNSELEKLAKSIETSCLKNGLIEIRWVEI